MEMKRVRRSWSGLAIALFSLMAVVAFPQPLAAQTEKEWSDVIAAAKSEGKLTVYVGINSTLTREIAKAFQAKYGIRVEILDGRPSEIRERIRSEMTAGRNIGDLSYNGGTSAELDLADGLFQPHGAVPNLKKIRSDFRLDGSLVPLQISSFGILINTTLVKPEHEPRSWLDLLDPRWNGKILADDPRGFGGGAIFFGVTLQKLGRDFHEKLAQQKPTFARGYPESERRVARGEFAMFIPDTMTSYPSLKGLPVKLLLPKEGNPYIVSMMSVIKGSRSPNAARLFLNYFLDDESLQKFGGLGFAGPVDGMAASAPPDFQPFLAPKLLGTLNGSQIEEAIATAKAIYK
jgi:iron(III) transport system substrate-binding protein